jgi:hypothetical protein
MKIKTALKYMFHFFCAISTFMFLIIGIQAAIRYPAFTLNGLGMLKVLSTAFVAVLPTLIFIGAENDTRKAIIIRRLLHFFITAGVTLGLQTYFGQIDAANAIVAVFAFLIIYMVMYTVIEIRAKKLADKLNERINAFHSAENETHRNGS